MSCRGIHLAITDEEVRALKSFSSDEERVTFIVETLMERYFPTEKPNQSAFQKLAGMMGFSSPRMSSSDGELDHQEAKRFRAESDKAWDGLHRALSDGTLDWGAGVFPLNSAILGGDRLFGSGGDELYGEEYLISLKSASAVEQISEALNALGPDEFRRRYFSIDQENYDGEIGEDDFDYTWRAFLEVRALFSEAASTQRHILFFADQ